MSEINDFINELPHKLKVECSLYIFENRYSKIKFFINQNSSFIAWMCPMLHPHQYDQDEYIYIEGDEVHSIDFLIEGSAAFVLPSFKNCRYIRISPGDKFGFYDIIGSVS